MLGPFSQYAFCIILLSFFSICEPGISRYSHMSTILSILTYYCQYFNTVVLYCLQIMSFQSMAGLNGEAAYFLPLADLVKILTTPGGHRASRGCEQYEQMKHRTHKIPYFFSFLYNKVLEMSSLAAALDLLPPHTSKACRISFFSVSSFALLREFCG